MVRKHIDWPKLNAMRAKATREGRLPITTEELTNLCHLVGVVFVQVTEAYYEIRDGKTSEILFEISVYRSASEFVEAFRGIRLL